MMVPPQTCEEGLDTPTGCSLPTVLDNGSEEGRDSSEVEPWSAEDLVLKL